MGRPFKLSDIAAGIDPSGGDPVAVPSTPTPAKRFKLSDIAAASAGKPTSEVMAGPGTSAQSIAEDYAEAVKAAAPSLQPDLTPAFEETERYLKRGANENEVSAQLESLKASSYFRKKGLEEAYEGLGRAEEIPGMRGSSILSTAGDALTGALKGAAPWIPSLGESGGKLIAEGLEASGRAGRALTTPGGGLFDWDLAENPAKWHEQIEKEAAGGHAGAKLQRQIVEGVGSSVGHPLGHVVATAGLGAQLPAIALGDLTLEEAKKGYDPTVAAVEKDTGRLGLTALSDPLVLAGELPALGAKALLRGAGKVGLGIAARVPALGEFAVARMGFPGFAVPEATAGRRSVEDLDRSARALRNVVEGQLGAEGGATKAAVAGASPLELQPAALGASPASAHGAANAYVKPQLESALETEFLRPVSDLPPYAQSALTNLMGSSKVRNLGAVTEAAGAPPWLQAGADWSDAAMNLLKRKRLVNKPSYNVKNTAGDIGAMFDRGVSLTELPNAHRVRSGKGSIVVDGKELSSEMFMDEFRRNVPRSPERAALPGEVPGGDALRGVLGDRLTDKLPGWAQEFASGTYTDRLGRWVPANAKYGANEDELTRLATYIWARKNGMTPAEAGREVASILPDYGKNLGAEGAALQAARIPFPYVNWAARAPLGAAKSILKNPRRAVLPYHIAQGYGAENEVPLPNDEQSTFRPGGQAQSTFERAFGLDPIPGQPAPVLGLNKEDALAPFATNPAQTLVRQLHPGIKTFGEAVTGSDWQTGEKRPPGSGWDRALRLGVDVGVDPLQEEVLNQSLSGLRLTSGETNVGPTPLSPFDKPAWDPKRETRLRQLGLFWPKMRIATPAAAESARSFSPAMKSLDAEESRLKDLLKKLEPPGGKKP